MHKITKGIKKKIKSKKGNKGEDLFDPAELEKYRKEKEEREVEEAEGGGGGAEKKEEGEEWQKFKALTAGVDSILKKTQGDLDRIKTTSYFQRKKPESSDSKNKKGAVTEPTPQEPAAKPKDKAKTKRWVGFEEGAGVDEGPPEEVEEEVAEEAQEVKLEVAEETPQVEEEEEEEEEEEDFGEDIFDTSYVDVVASGEVKLAYIPESPTDDGPAEDDPFDTSIVEKVIGPEPPPGKKPRPLVSLGCAVEVLTGKSQGAVPTNLTLQASKKRRQVPTRSPQEVDLFVLDDEAADNQEDKEISLSGSEEPQSQEPAGESVDPFGALDDSILPDTTPIKEVISSIAQSAPSAPVEDKESESGGIIKDLVAEFDIIRETEEVEEDTLFGRKSEVKDNKEEREEDDDEFAVLAAESVKKHPSQTVSLQLNAEEDKEAEGDPFDTTAAGILEDLEEDDPFDTSAAAGVLGELPATSHKKPPARPPRPVSSPDVDILLGDNQGGDADWEEFEQGRSSTKGPPPLRPAPPLQRPPLPTSALPTKPITAETAGPESASITGVSQPQLAYTGTSITEITCALDSTFETTEEKDPFDTSFADVAAIPGKTELRLIESEILGDIEEVFNPRSGENLIQEKEVQSTVTIHISLHTDEEEAEEETERDPEIDSERRVSEDLFTEEEEDFVVPSLQLSQRDLLGGSRTDLSQLGHDPISPDEAVLSTEEQFEQSYIDPFDTSIVDPKIAPGKAELKILEKELLGEDTTTVTEPLKRSDSDSDFNPREGEEKPLPTLPIGTLSVGLNRSEQQGEANNSQEAQVLSPSTRPDLLSAGGDVDTEFSKPLTPFVEEGEKLSEPVLEVDSVDPFDTTFAENILPGRAELRIIESELFGEQDNPEGKRASLSDSDFDPRETEKNISGQDWVETEAASTIDTSHTSDSTVFSGSSDKNTRPRILPPSTLPLQCITNPAVVPTVSPTKIQENQPDLLAVEEEHEESVKPLSPSRNTEETEEEGDPFDTSTVSVDVLKPGKAELKVLESELIREEIEVQQPTVFQTTITAQILVSQYQAVSQAQAANITKPPSPPVQQPDFLNLSELDEDKSAGPKPLTPLVGKSTSPEEDDFDPFDTSIAEGIGPGKTELKVLESELIGH